LTLLYITLIVAVGLTFDFTNGFHDSANAVAAPIVSTTQVVTGSIVGSDAEHLWRHTHWNIAGHVGIAWLITMPSAAAIGALFDLVHRIPGGEAITLVLILLGAALFWVERRKIFGGWHAAESKGPVEEPAVQPA
jgi:hypothetical protein